MTNLIYLYFFLQWADCITTLCGLSFPGIKEGNPVAQAILDAGVAWFFILKLGPALILIALRNHISRWLILWFILTDGLLLGAVLNNLYLIWKQL